MTRRLVFLALAAMMLGMGCGGKGSGGKTDKSAEKARVSLAKTSNDEKGARAAWGAFLTALKSRDRETVWAFISTRSRKWLVNGPWGARLDGIKHLPDDLLAKIALAADTTPEAIKKMDRAGLAKVMIVSEAIKNREQLIGAEVKEVTLKEGRAILTLRKPDGGELRQVLIHEEGSFRLDGEATARLKQRAKKVVPR